MHKVKYLCIASVMLCNSLLAQELLLTGAPVYLQRSSVLPKNLLTTKTAVIVDVGISGLDWKKVSEEAHTQFKRTGIDAIAYFQWNQLFSGYEPQKEISEFLSTRQVSNLILINAQRNQSEIWLTNFNGTWTFLGNNQDTWYSRDSTVYKALLPLYQKAGLELERKNLLISDWPEYYENMVFHKEKINRSYPPNVKGFRTGVAQMPMSPLPAELADNLSRAYTLYDDALKMRNKQIRDLIESYYPFMFDFFDYGLTLNQIRTDKNCNFYLGYVYGTALDISQMFKVGGNNLREIQINAVLSEKPILRNISADRKIFKFYLRNTVTGEIFIGSGWDGDITIDDALHNFIFYMKRDLKVNP